MEVVNTYKPVEEIVKRLQSEGTERTRLFSEAAEAKRKMVGNIVYFRGLIEYSNICHKNCLYCGIRRSNKNISRYVLSEEDVLQSARFAMENGYGSIVLQSGEMTSSFFVNQITGLVRAIKKISGGKLGITLSCGEQSPETYQQWFEAGAHRYLLRIESASRQLYESLHPAGKLHSFESRLRCLHVLKTTGYQVGTGVMVGLPNQTYTDLANDLLFMKELDVDMVGMGPYIEHSQTPLATLSGELLPMTGRFDLTLKMIALLRLMMPDINIAAATAMQAIDKGGREKAILAGANVVMPNITPGVFRDSYKLYENKPCIQDQAEDCKSCLEARIALTGHTIGYHQWGDSLHFKKKT